MLLLEEMLKGNFELGVNNFCFLKRFLSNSHKITLEFQ